MATVGYQGFFTLRNNLTEIPAMVCITTSDLQTVEVFASYKKLRLAEDPIVITWDNAELTDVIHRSQMMVSLFAKDDGDYRDIFNATEAVNGYLYVKSGESWRLLWAGKKADLTWEEPFSKAQNYALNVTFSDFGYLSREDNSIALYTGYRTVRDLLSDLVKELFPYARLDIHDSANSLINSTDFMDAKLRSTVLLEDDRVTRKKASDVVEDILAPAGLHIMQYGGAFHVFAPDLYTVDERDGSGNRRILGGSLRSAGADSRIAAADYFNHVRLEYEQEEDLRFEGTRQLSAADSGYVGPWIGGDHPEGYGGYFLLSAEKHFDPTKVEGYLANYIEGAKVAPCVLLSANDHGHEPSGTFMYQITSEINDRDIPDFPLTVEIGGGNSPRFYEYPGASTGDLELVLPFYMRIAFNAGQQIMSASMRFSAEFIEAESGVHKYLRTGDNMRPYWTDIASEGNEPILTFTPKDGLDNYTFLISEWENFNCTIPPIDKAGRLDIVVKPNTIFLNETNPETPYTVEVYAVKLPELKSHSTVSQDMINETALNEADFALGSHPAEDFEKSFRLGTPVLGTLATLSNYIDADGNGTVPEDSRLLDFYMDFMRANYDLSYRDRYRRRWRISGSYRYDHLGGFPIFLANQCRPLKTLADEYFAFMINHEEWHVRNGLCYLDLEEFDTSFYPRRGFLLTSEQNDTIITEDNFELLIFSK